MQIGGGLGEEYMRAPALNVGGGGQKGGGGFFANLLDLLGIHKQVAKEPNPKKDEAKAPESQANPVGKVTGTGGAPAFTPGMGAPASPQAAPPPPGLTVLDDAEAAFSPLRPQASKFGMGLNFLPGPGLR